MNDKQQPWLKWYPTDWRADPLLRMCSLAARGMWIELLGYMHEAAPYGHLLINCKQPTDAQIATLVGSDIKTVRAALAELEAAGVFSRDEDGSIFSRRMVRDAEKRERDKGHGARGGNPTLKGGVNPPDKAQRPEASNQKPEQKRKAREPAAPFALPDWVPPDEWRAFDAMRTAKAGKAWTDDGRRFAVNTLAQLRAAGQDCSAVLRQTVERTWTGLFPVKPEVQARGREPTLAEKRAANVAAMTGQTRHVIDINAARVDSTVVLADDDRLRKPLLPDVGRRSAGGGDPGLG